MRPCGYSLSFGGHSSGVQASPSASSAYMLDALGLQWTEGEWPPRLKTCARTERQEQPEEATA